jgi:serine/threonine-protein kinase
MSGAFIMELTPETILNNLYRIVQQLGQGGMGAVYLAYNMSLEHQVAIKVNRNPSEQSTSQFLREARLLAALRHPNLPRVIDYFVSGPEQFLVMDYVPGDDLGSLMEKQGAQPLDRVLNWAQQLGSALSYLHKQTPPVIHRDVKPSNIKLNNESEAMLVDFGIAKTSDSSQATATGAVGYTPGYAPPEQYRSSRTGPHSDQYSLAATLYALLTGQKPVESVERALGNAVLSPMNLLNPAIPAQIQQVIEKARSTRPEERFSSVNEFVGALNDPPYQPTIRPAPQLQPAPAVPPAKASPRRRNGLLGAGIGAGIVLVLMLCAGPAFLYLRNITLDLFPAQPYDCPGKHSQPDGYSNSGTGQTFGNSRSSNCRGHSTNINQPASGDCHLHPGAGSVTILKNIPQAGHRI